MTKWYYRDADREVGPLEASELKRLAGSGKLLPSDAVRREDMQNWTPANRIKGLFGADSASAASSPSNSPSSSSSDNIVSAAFESAHSAAAEQTGDSGSGLVGSMKKAAVLAGKHAQLKTLTWDLHVADEAIGIKAHASQIGHEIFAPLYDQISQLDEEVATKRRAEPVSPNESMADKAKRMAYEAKKKVTVEGLLSERKKLLRELGEGLRIGNAADAKEIRSELKQARSAQTKVDKMRAEIAVLSRQSPRLLRKIMLVAVLVGLSVTGYWGYGLVVSAKRNYDQQAILAEIQARAAIDVERRKAELAEAQRKRDVEAAERMVLSERIKAEAAALEQKRQLDTADREARRKLEEDRTALEVQQRIAEADKKAKEQDLARMETNKRRQAESQVQSAVSQGDRQQLANDQFGPIVLDPAQGVLLSKSMQEAYKATVELRGPKYIDIAELHRQRNWLGLINLLTDKPNFELPEATAIESAARKLLAYDFIMLVKIDPKLISRNDPRRMYLISFPLQVSKYYAEVVAIHSNWERHPDGIGFLHTWHPSDGHSIILAATQNVVSRAVQQLNEQAQFKLRELQSKLKLGEIDEVSLQKDMAVTVGRLHDQAVLWAKSQ